MNHIQYRTVSEKLKLITDFIGDLAGFTFDEGPLDFYPDWYDEEEKACVKKELLTLLYKKENTRMFKENSVRAKRLENLFQSIIDCL